MSFYFLRSSHFVSIRKAVKAALFLLPLLGILHILETFVSASQCALGKVALRTIEICLFVLSRRQSANSTVRHLLLGDLSFIDTSRLLLFVALLFPQCRGKLASLFDGSEITQSYFPLTMKNEGPRDSLTSFSDNSTLVSVEELRRKERSGSSRNDNHRTSINH